MPCPIHLSVSFISAPLYMIPFPPFSSYRLPFTSPLYLPITSRHFPLPSKSHPLQLPLPIPTIQFLPVPLFPIPPLHFLLPEASQCLPIYPLFAPITHFFTQITILPPSRVSLFSSSPFPLLYVSYSPLRPSPFFRILPFPTPPFAPITPCQY